MNRKLLAGAVLGASILAAVVSSLNKPKSRYARTVSEFLAHPTRDESVRIQGALVPGSLVQRSDPCEYRFRLVDRWSPSADAGPSAARAELSVRYPYCVVPDTFRDAPGFELEQVTVEGKLCGSCHSFEASQIVAKARGPYEMKERSRRGVPKAPIGL